MIVCNRCGNREPDGSKFCGNCSAFLEFEGSYAESEPVIAASPDEPGSGAVQPGEVQRAPRVRLEMRKRAGHGEIPCPKCGAGNDPVRRFCHSCGTALHPETVAPSSRPPWWRRLLRRHRYQAGQRRRIRQPPRIRKRWIVLAVAVVLVAVFAGQLRMFGRLAETEVRDRISSRAPITPARLTASGVLGGNTADRIADRDTEKFWAPSGNPEGAWIEAELPRPVRLLGVIVSAGRSQDATKFQQQGRPHEVELAMTSPGGAVTTQRIVLLDRAGPQSFEVKADQAVKVRLTVVSAHGMAPGRYLAVAEVEFFYRN